MTFTLEPETEPGKKFVDTAAELIPDLRSNANAADSTSTMAAASIEALQQSGIAAAFVPEELGGWGLSSIRDWMLGIAALARGDASIAIGINMHLAVSRGMSTAFQQSGGNIESRSAAPLKAIANQQMLICATATERGSDNLHPLTEATDTDGEWFINGTKLFVTMSPLATHLAMNLRLRDAEGDHLVTTMMPIDTPGLNPQDDWDALGMRGSGSQSIQFDNVRVERKSLRRLGPWGEWSTGVLVNRTLGNVTLVAAFLGVAEHAREIALESLAKQTRNGEAVSSSPAVQQHVGEMEIELTRCRALLDYTGRGIDDWLRNAIPNPPSREEAHSLMQAYQASKWSINRGAIEIVDKAMDLSGGGAFMSGHPLSRLYRDVRAGPFMQPHSPVDIRRYVGQVALSLYPDS